MTNEQKNAAKKAANNVAKAKEMAVNAAKNAAKAAVEVAKAEETVVNASKNAAAKGVTGMSGGARRTKSHKQALRRLNKAMTKINNAVKGKKRSTRRRKD